MAVRTARQQTFLAGWLLNRDTWTFFGLLALVGVLVILPVAAVIFSLRTGSPGAPDAAFTLDHWIAVYTIPAYVTAFLNTLAIAVLVTIFSTLIGLTLAVLLARTDTPGTGWLDVAVIIPQFLSPFTSALAWIVLASPRTGLINVALQNLGLSSGPVFDIFSLGGIVWVMSLYFAPYAYLNAAPALLALDPARSSPSRRYCSSTSRSPISTPSSASACARRFSFLRNRIEFTALYVTHDQTEALAMSNRVVVMDQGHIQQIGHPCEIYARPVNAFVADFIGATNLVFATVTSRENGVLATATPFGPLLVAATADHRPGDQVALSIRPEALRTDGEPGGAVTNCWTGEVTHTSFIGAQVEYHVKLGDTFLRGVADPRRAPSVGDRTPICVHPDDALVLPAGEELTRT
ncbi:MAG: TOBE domain-containing protein [Chloroflexi bacterium]|nr:TOBE domain-containing protein [Chloroflexota bacterium]